MIFLIFAALFFRYRRFQCVHFITELNENKRISSQYFGWELFYLFPYIFMFKVSFKKVTSPNKAEQISLKLRLETFFLFREQFLKLK